MIIIADSGATKTSWRCVDEGRVVAHAETAGMNPHAADFAIIYEAAHAANRQLQPISDEHWRLADLFFYGAGCGDVRGRTTLRDVLAESFPCSVIDVETDLMGACRALLGEREGYVGILGTGSNFCHYDPRQPEVTGFSLGYLLGDEGSGCHIGRLLLKAYLRHRLPADLMEAFERCYPDMRDTYRERLYGSATPTRFLASLVSFVADHRSHEAIQVLLDGAFDAYMHEVALSVDGAPIELNLVGGIAVQFADEVRRAAMRQGMTTGLIAISPIEGLVRYHSSADNDKTIN